MSYAVPDEVQGAITVSIFLSRNKRCELSALFVTAGFWTDQSMYTRLTFQGLGSLPSRWETLEWIRSEFEQHRKERDLVRRLSLAVSQLISDLKLVFNAYQQAKIKSLLSNGKRQLKQLSNSGMLVGQDGDKFRGRRAIT